MLVKAKVLIIDQSESTRTFMRFILSNSGYRITAVDNAAKTAELLEEELFDVIIIDPRLADKDGLELVSEIREIKAFAEIPILAVTQFFNTENQGKEAEAGISHWITQPVSPHKLIEIMKEISPDPEEYDDDMINSLVNQNQ